MRKAGPAVLLLVVVLGVSFLALSRASRTNRSVAREVTSGAPEPAGSALGAHSAFARSPVAVESPRQDDVTVETAPMQSREQPAAAIDETPTEHFLHVRARDTGQELDSVLLRELLPVLRGSPHDTLHPGSEANALARAVGPSPVRIDEREGAWLSSRVFYAKSPGYAWGRIELEAARAEDTLLLDPAGALELVVLRGGEPWEPGVEIEVYPSGSESSRELLLVELGATRTLVIEDLPAGLVSARARSYGREVGMVEVEVKAGERTIATLELRPPSSA